MPGSAEHREGKNRKAEGFMPLIERELQRRIQGKSAHDKAERQQAKDRHGDQPMEDDRHPTERGLAVSQHGKLLRRSDEIFDFALVARIGPIGTAFYSPTIP
ncbi:hypothetical protein D3C72_2158860 [compost metagenome]